MKIPYYQVNAFTREPFGGNPAGVCELADWLPDRKLQAIAAENNLSETAFLVRSASGYDLRWFTPQVEVDLCGHATLAGGLVVLRYLEPSLTRVEFNTRSGVLKVARKEGGLLALDFPSRKAKPCPLPSALVAGLKARPQEIYLARDHLAVFDSEEVVRAMQPQMAELIQLDSLGVIVSAPGSKSDFVSRFFAPKVGIPEDPVTGSAHCTLIPYWAERLHKTRLHALQLSARGGELFCEDQGERVSIAGYAVVYKEGQIYVD